MVGDLTDGDHSIPSREVSNVIDLSVDRLQASKELFPSLADLVTALREVAGRPNEEYVGAARKTSPLFFPRRAAGALRGVVGPAPGLRQ